MTNFTGYMNKRRKIEVGKIYETNGGNSVLVLDIINCYEIRVRFNDAHKHETTASASNIRSGKVRNPYQPSVQGVGYLGCGGHVSSINGSHTQSYKAWKGMITRCYGDSSLLMRASYEGVTVCEEWHNFQVFAEWYVNHEHYGMGYYLDKDLLVKGNKVYSPQTCCLVPRELNSILSDRSKDRGSEPLGVSFDNNRGLYVARLSKNGRIKTLGRHKTISEAQEVYKEAKEAHVKDRANYWRNNIGSDVYLSLMSWEYNDG